MLLFLILVAIVCLVGLSFYTHQYSKEKFQYSPYCISNWITVLCSLIGPFIVFVMLFGMGPKDSVKEIVVSNWYWLLTLLGVVYVMVKNIRKTNFVIGVFSTITLIPYSVFAFLAVKGLFDEVKRIFGGR